MEDIETLYTKIMYALEKDDVFNARKILNESNIEKYTDKLAVLESELCYREEDYKKMFYCIKEGLKYNYKNYELYYMLGTYYSVGVKNLCQAYLCYQQALFYCDSEEDREEIYQIMVNGEICTSVPNCSIVIVSYNAKEKMQLCLDSIRENTDKLSTEVVVVDNASTDGVIDYLRTCTDIVLVESDTNLGFPAGCNVGIANSKKDNDIFLLNNDTVVPPNALFWLRMGLYENDKIGGTGSISNSVSNHQMVLIDNPSPENYYNFAIKNNVPMLRAYENRIRLIGFAYLIKRTVLNKVGMLDECFTPGNYEDDDLSLRIIKEGYCLLLCKNSFVYHWGSASFRKDVSTLKKILEINKEKLSNKIGFDPTYFYNMRVELYQLMDFSHKDYMYEVLEIGCGLGCTLGDIMNQYANVDTYGIEIVDKVVEYASKYNSNIVQGNIEKLEEFPYGDKKFDYIIMADVLENLHDPEKVVLFLRNHLKSTGKIIASISNLMHYSIIVDLLQGNFTYQNAGLLDRTHIHMFTLKEILRMFMNCGYRVNSMRKIFQEDCLDDIQQKLYNELKLPIP